MLEEGVEPLALSGLFTMAFDTMKETVDAVSGAALRDKVKLIIDGGPVSESVVGFTGADVYGKDAAEAVRLASSFLTW